MKDLGDRAEVIRVGVMQNLESNVRLVGLYLNGKGEHSKDF